MNSLKAYKTLMFIKINHLTIINCIIKTIKELLKKRINNQYLKIIQEAKRVKFQTVELIPILP